MYLDLENISVSAISQDTVFSVSETLLEQGSGPSNDDALSVQNGIYIVCDGATSLVKDTDERLMVSGGREAARITADVFSVNDGSLSDMTSRANELIRSAMHDVVVDTKVREHLWTTSFAAAKIVHNRLEWAQAGDCMIMCIYDDGSSRLVTEETGQDVDVLEKWKSIGPGTAGSIHQVLAKEIAAVRRKMNREYGVLNGEPESIDFIRYGSESLKSVATILIFSDGLWLPSRFPGNGLDAEGLAALYGKSGLMGVRDHIRTVQRSDPRCCRYPRFKKHDDISAIVLTKRSGLIQEAYHKNN